ncbi:hypothetical protein D3C78_648820 [compost metagenome]
MTIGKKIGMVSRIIDMVSITQPRIRYSSRIPASTTKGGRPLLPIRSARATGSCERARNEFITSAPSRIMKIIAVVTAVP